VRVALALGLALLALAGALVIAKAPARVVATNSIKPRVNLSHLRQGEKACQGGEALPKGTSAVRLDVVSVVGPSVTVSASEGGRVLSEGTRGSGWTGAAVTVPVAPLAHAARDATLCLSIGPTREVLTMIGGLSPTAGIVLNGDVQTRGRVGVEYLAPGKRSWWSLALSVARHMGLGRAPSGTWVALAVALVMAFTAALGLGVAILALGSSADAGDPGPGRRARLLGALPRPFARVPGIAWACALVAFLNAACWSELSPPLQTPDEPAHFAYVQVLAETHRIPTHGVQFSPEEEAALTGLRHNFVQYVPNVGTISSRAQQRRLEDDLTHGYSRVGPGEAGTAASEPPLYYALETIPYELGSSGTLLVRLQLMRLLSALFGGLTALFAYLFVREALPGAPWAWTVGGLGVAFAPLLGFMSGAISPDALLATISAALFYVLARAFRRGLSPRLAGAIGVTLAAGSITKLNFFGLIPGTLAALVLLVFRIPRASRRRASAALAAALAIAVSPSLIYPGLASSASRPPLSVLSTTAVSETHQGSVLAEISYIWELFLPRLPGMANYFPGVSTWRQLWFNGLVGLYGWADTLFPVWVYEIALVPATLLALLCARELLRARTALRRRAGELAVYALMCAGVLALVGGASYPGDVFQHEGPFWEPRYFLPLLPLLGVLLALAARGAGRRWGPAAGMLIVALLLAHDLFSQLLVISRYYG
jgi:hypothetical protein